MSILTVFMPNNNYYYEKKTQVLRACAPGCKLKPVFFFLVATFSDAIDKYC